MEAALVQLLPTKQEQPVLQFYQQPSSYQTPLSSLCQPLDASPHDYLRKLSSASGVIIKSKRALIYIDLSNVISTRIVIPETNMEYRQTEDHKSNG